MICVMKHKTIRNHKDFLTTPHDLVVYTEYFVLKAKSAKYKNDNRYGLVAAKRTFKLAVHRNRAKRLLRDWLSFNEELMLPDLDYIIIARLNILNCDREDGRSQMYQALTKIAQMHIHNGT